MWEWRKTRAAELKAQGFGIETVDAEVMVDLWGVHGGPWLMVFDTRGVLRYSGGYAPRRPVYESDFRDLRDRVQTERGR